MEVLDSVKAAVVVFLQVDLNQVAMLKVTVLAAVVLVVETVDLTLHKQVETVHQV